MSKEKSKEKHNFERNELLNHLQWELDRKTAHIRSFENRLLTVLSIDSVIVGLLATFYSLNPTIRLYEKCLLIVFGVSLAIIIGFLLYLWWPRKASKRKSQIELKDRIRLEDINQQLNILDSTLKIRARLVYAGLVGFSIQLVLLFTIILVRLYS